MPRKKKRPTGYGNVQPYRTAQVEVYVPKRYAGSLPRVLDAAPTLLQQRRTRHLRLKLRTRGPVVKRKVLVRYRDKPRVGPAYTSISRRGVLTHHSNRSTRRLLSTEYWRPRREERKGARRRRSSADLASVRRDPFGIIASNATRSIMHIQDAAMVSRALEFRYGNP